MEERLTHLNEERERVQAGGGKARVEKQHEKFLDALKLVTHAVSLGDIETLIVYYDRNSDKLPHYPAVYQEGFFRFSIGLEDAEDIIADLTQAMQAAGML